MSDAERVDTGVSGLNEILFGGLVPHRSYLVRGGPGTGKTTLGMHFLAAGAERGERCLFITLGESADNLRQNAKSVEIDVSRVEFLDLSPNSDFFSRDEGYDLFSSAEVERDPITKSIVGRVEQMKPQRVFLDSTSHLRYLAIDAHQFRKQLLSFIRFLMEQRATVLFTSESTAVTPDDDVMYLSDGVVQLSLTATGRRIAVTKFRGSDFRVGEHTLRLTGAGYQVFPILVPQEHGRRFEAAAISSGVTEIDALLGGGLERGTVTIISGPAGVGKTTLGLQFLKAAAENNERSVLYAFEESADIILRRAEAVGIPVGKMIDSGMLSIFAIEPLLLSRDEIAAQIRNEVENHNTRLVMLDSNAGYRLALGVDDLLVGLRSIYKYLTNMGVTVISINEVESITGDFRPTESGLSFMVDNLIFLRYLELRGEMRKAIGVLKKRMSDFERHLREYAITADGIEVGRPLVDLRGILRGDPEWIKESDKRGSPQNGNAE